MSLFSKKLLQWNEHFNTRQMPWKGIKEPYKIWLSEVILQQTRVEQGWNYYEKFIENYPTICDLAKAQDEVVFKLWEGLGYYNRCKNLLFTARYICDKLHGKFPEKYEEVLDLKGVGSYTASAICSFAYNLPYAVVDGNVFRVLSRIYGIEKPIDSIDSKKFFTQIAQENLDKKEPAFYNQAIMDFGATVCKPVNPNCANCVMTGICEAHNRGIVNLLPIKEKMLTRKTRYFTWFILSVKNELFIHKRIQNDIWQNLHEFYLQENEEKFLWNEEKANTFIYNQFSKSPVFISISKEFSQQLTHQKIKTIFIFVELKHKPDSLKSGMWVEKDTLSTLAFPKIINDYFLSPSL